MPRLPQLKAKELAKIAEHSGFVFDRQKGSHRIYIRFSDRKVISIPFHTTKDLGRGLTAAIIKQIGLTNEGVASLLKG